MNEVNELANIPKEGDEIQNLEIFKENQDEPAKETPAASPAENKPEEKPASSQAGDTENENNLPFHKHPRWIERENQFNNKLTALQSDYEGKLSAIEQKLSGLENRGKPVEIPKWFSGIYGNDTQAWSDYLADQKARLDEAKAEILADQSRSQRAEREEQEKWNTWVDSELSKLEGEGKTFDRQKLIKVAVEYMPTDSEGNIDLHKAYDLMTKLEPQNAPQPSATPSSQARKAIGAQVTATTKGESKPPSFQTPQTMRKSWTGLLDDE